MFAAIYLDYLIDVVLVAALIWIAREDLLRFRVSNKAIIGLGASFIVTCLSSNQLSLLVSHALLSLVALIVLLGAFAVRVIGGGDAKLLSIALLWLGPEHILAFALLLLAAVITYAIGARFCDFPSRQINGSLRIPLAPCVSAAWIITLGLPHSFL